MQAPRRPRPVLLRAAALLAAPAALAACDNGDGGAPGGPPPLDGELYPPCAGYADIEEAYGFCIYKHAGGFPTREEVDRFCPRAGSWEAECRHAWVSGRTDRSSGFGTEELLAVCAGNVDCAFELLDFRPSDDVIEQFELCLLHVGKYGDDCAGHALQRWWFGAPDAADVARVADARTPFAEKVGYFVGASIACAGVGACGSRPDVVRVCENAVDHLTRNPHLCPQRSLTPMRPEMEVQRGEVRPPSGPMPPAPGTVKEAPEAGLPPGTPPPDNTGGKGPAAAPGGSHGPAPGQPGGPTSSPATGKGTG